MTPPRQSDRGFGLSFAALFAIIAAASWLITGEPLAWAIVLAVAFLIVAQAQPALLLPLNRIWRQLAIRLGVINNHLILGLFFYAVVLPFGFVLRIFGWDPMGRKTAKDAATYWTPVAPRTTEDHYRDPF